MTRKPLHWCLLVLLVFAGCDSEPKVTRAPAGTDSEALPLGSQTDAPQAKRPLKIAD